MSQETNAMSVMLSYVGSIKKQSELQRCFEKPGQFKKVCVNGDVRLPDKSLWRKIPYTPNNKLLWVGMPKTTVLFECIEVEGIEAEENA